MLRTYAPKWGCRHESESAWESFSWLVAADHADTGEQEARLSTTQMFGEGTGIHATSLVSIMYTYPTDCTKMPEITPTCNTKRAQISTFVTLIVHEATFSWI